MPKIVIDIVLGLVQGLTEFLPVSSSGHLVVVPALAGWSQPSVSFDLTLHVATLLAVLFYFRIDLANMALALVGRGPDPRGERRIVGLLAIGTIPAVIAGGLFKDTFESLFEKPGWVTVFWIVTAVVLLAGERAGRRAGDVAVRNLTVTTALLIGVAQAAAITPGISRSGATIAAGLALGLTRSDAARFSFLLAIPAIAGAAVTLIPDVANGSFQLTGAVVAGFLVAAISGYLAIAALLRFVRTRSLAPFSAYLAGAAPLAALLLWIT